MSDKSDNWAGEYPQWRHWLQLLGQVEKNLIQIHTQSYNNPRELGRTCFRYWILAKLDAPLMQHDMTATH